MEIASQIIGLSLILLSLGVVPLAVLFIRAIRARPALLLGNSFSPPALLVLSLRGADPELDKCLEAILTQDYPDYEVRIIVDSEEDPAWKIVQNTIQSFPGHPRVSVMPLTKRLFTCSLKCSALIQALTDIPKSIEVIAVVDADVIPHPTWLRELIAPLQDPQVGATGGNRWYIPPSGKLGPVFRYLWNAIAINFMFSFHIPWGGTLALRTKVLRQGQVLEKWGKAISDDMVVNSAILQQGLHFHFVPSLMMFNQGNCSFSEALNFMFRQHVVSDLYHPKGLTIFLIALPFALIQTMAIFGIFLAAWEGEWNSVFYILAGIAGFCLIGLAILWALERNLKHTFPVRGQKSLGWFSPTLFLALPLTQFLSPMIIIWAHFCRNFEWRGVRYRVRGPWQIQRMDLPVPT